MKQKLLLKSMLLLFALVAGSSSVWATDYSYTFSSQQYTAAGAKTLNGVSWTMAGTGGSYFGYDGTKGQQFGSGSKPYSALSLSTSGISGTITSVAVNTSGANSIAGTVAVSVGGSAFNCSGNTTASLTASATTYTFTGSASGDVVISWAQTSSKAIYVKSITVTYSGGGGSSVDAPSFSPAAGAVAAGTTVTLTQAAADQIRYTTNGDNPTKTTGTVYSTPIVITTATTIKAIAIKGDDVSSVATANYTINVAEPTFSLGDGGGKYLTGSTFTITSADNTIYYTTNGGTPSSASTLYSGSVSILEGNVTYKAIAYDTYGNPSSVVSRSYTGINPTTLPFNWAGGGKDALTALTGVLGNGLPSDYTDDKYSPYFVKLDGTGDYIAIFTNEKPVKVTMGVKMAGGATTSKITVQQSVDGVTFTDVEELTISGSKDDVVNLATTKSFADATRVVKLYFTKGSNVGVGPISIFSDDDIPVTITSAGWASFSNASALDFTGTGVTPHIAKEKDASNVTLSPIAKVPAETGIVVNAAAAGTYAIPVLSDAADATEGNLLKPWLTAGTPTEGTYYTLAAGPKFKKSSGGTLAAGKAYLVMPAAAAPELGVDFGNTTSIDAIQKQAENGEFYNLAGQRVAKPTKGLYIVNGKKVVVK